MYHFIPPDQSDHIINGLEVFLYEFSSPGPDKMVVLILYNNKISSIREVTLDILKTVRTNLMIKSGHKQENSNILDLLAANIFT